MCTFFPPYVRGQETFDSEQNVLECLRIYIMKMRAYCTSVKLLKTALFALWQPELPVTLSREKNCTCVGKTIKNLF